jgi:hypothetical protein
MWKLFAYLVGSHKRLIVEVNGYYSKHFEALKALLDAGIG